MAVLITALGCWNRLRSILELSDCCAAKSPLNDARPASREETMPIYKAPLEDVSFLLNDVFQIDRYDNLPGFSDASADVREAILAEAAKLSEEVLQPLNRIGDLEGCTAGARHPRPEADLCAENGGGRVDRHHESDRAALRY